MNELNYLFNNGTNTEEENQYPKTRKLSHNNEGHFLEEYMKKKKEINETNDEYSISKYMDIANCLKEDYFNFKDLKSNSIVSLSTLYHPIDKYFRVNKKHDRNVFTKKDVVYFNNRFLKMSNSVLFYLNHYYQKSPYFKFNSNLQSIQHSVLSQ